MNLAEAELGALQEDSDDHVKTSVVSPGQERADHTGRTDVANNSYLPAINERNGRGGSRMTADNINKNSNGLNESSKNLL